MINDKKRDAIHNALLIGMALEDAYVYANLTPTEISDVSDDEQLQREWSKRTREYEFTLLSQMNDIASKQARMGKEQATIWLLEHMFPRYSGKPQDNRGAVHIHFQGNEKLEQMDTVEIFNPEQEQEQEQFNNSGVDSAD